MRARGAGTAAWLALTCYVRGTVAVAAIHAVVIGFALWVLGVPLRTGPVEGPDPPGAVPRAG